MPGEVRYHMLRPEEIVARRRECPIAYVPIGTLEWHGPHNPVGADALQAEALAVRCAERGGLAFPPLYWGESRVEGLMEADSGDREQIAHAMGLPPGNFDPGRMPFSAAEQALAYQRLLIHILAELETLGFEVGVLVAGHYPLIDHARAAVLTFHQSRCGRSGTLLPWAFCDYLLLADSYEVAGDHGAGWETSHLLSICPDRVRMDLLPPRGERVLGVAGRMPPQEATAEFGEETLEAAVRVAVAEAHHRLHNRHLYAGHGACLREGLWRKGG